MLMLFFPNDVASKNWLQDKIKHNIFLTSYANLETLEPKHLLSIIDCV